MLELFEIVGILLLIIIVTFYLLGILFISLISVVYVVGYIYDSVIGNSLLKIGYIAGNKFPKLKENVSLKELWIKIQPKKLYMRYETPLLTYCFSYSAVSLIVLALPDKGIIGLVLASILYLMFYFIGMFRKCGISEQYFEEVLNNNMDFLKLSFLPLGFVITVLGFCFTITGLKVQEIPIDLTIFQSIYTNLMDYSDETNTLIRVFRLFGIEVILSALFYIMSLPIQVASYFTISVINYFKRYKTAYVRLLKNYIRILITLLKSIWKIIK